MMNKALSDVRRSYRIIQSYQKSVLRICDFIASRFEDADYVNWRPIYWDAPNSKKIFPSVGKYSVDGLPFYAFSKKFILLRTDGADVTWGLEISHVADSALYDLDCSTDPNFSDAESPDACSSEIYLCAWHFRSPIAERDWAGFQCAEYWPDCDCIWTSLKDYDGAVLGQTINLQDITDRANLEETVHKFRQELWAAGLISTTNRI